MIRKLLLALAVPVLLMAQTPVTIQNNGPITSRVDILILGDGYTSAQLPQFAADVNTTLGSPSSRRTRGSRTASSSMFTGSTLRARNPGSESCGHNGEQRVRVRVQLREHRAADLRRFYEGAQRDSKRAASAARHRTDSGERHRVRRIGRAVRGSVAEFEFGGDCVARDRTLLRATRRRIRRAAAARLRREPRTIPGRRDVADESHAGEVGARGSRRQPRFLTRSTPVASTPGLYEGAGLLRYAGMYRPTYMSKMRALGYPYDQINTEQFRASILWTCVADRCECSHVGKRLALAGAVAGLHDHDAAAR